MEQEKNEGTVFIGDKPCMVYVTSVVMQYNSGAKKILVKARGKNISKAVDVVEATKNKFLKDLKISNIKVGSESFEGREKKTITVSTIEIEIEK